MDRSASPEKPIKHDKYVLPRSEIERKRLDNQHEYLTEVLSGRLIVPDDVQLGPGSRVLDSGTGTGAWIIALSNMVSDSVELVGGDISNTMFPTDLPSNVKLYKISSSSLPTEWTNSFDLINQRLLLGSFTIPMWQTVLSEQFRVLKPGGAIQLMEYGWTGVREKSISLVETKKFVEIGTAVMNKRDLLGWESGRQLPTLLEEAGFCDINTEVCQAPLGGSWGEIGSKGAGIWTVAFRGFGAALLAEGGLGICKSQADVDEIIDCAQREWEKIPGVFCEFHVVTAKKPS